MLAHTHTHTHTHLSLKLLSLSRPLSLWFHIESLSPSLQEGASVSSLHAAIQTSQLWILILTPEGY